MNRFLKNIVILGLSLIIMSIILDKVYTYFHYHGAPRNIPDYIMSLNQEDSLDYAVFGSSRVLHAINTNLIERKTKKKGFNFGVPGSSVFEIKLSVQQIIKRKVTKNIYIQMDYIWNEIGNGGECTVDWLTYIKEDDVWTEFQSIDQDKSFYYYRYIPFLRYCEYGSKLGFRELIMSLSNRKMTLLNNKGFAPLFGNIKTPYSEMTYKLNEEMNRHILDLIKLCESEGVNLYFFTSPIFNFSGNNDILQKSLPNYIDFSQSISDPKFFRDNTHLNELGSNYFTTIFMKEFIE